MQDRLSGTRACAFYDGGVFNEISGGSGVLCSDGVAGAAAEGGVNRLAERGVKEGRPSPFWLEFSAFNGYQRNSPTVACAAFSFRWVEVF